MNTNETPKNDTPVNANTTEGAPVQGTTSPPEGAAPASTTAPATPEVAAAPTPPAAPLFTFTISGVVNGKVQVPADTKVKDAIKLVDSNAAPSTYQLRTSAGEAIGLERMIRENLSVTSTKKASGG